MPVAVTDPGADGLLGSADDGATVTAYNLTAESLGAPPVNLTTNLPDSDSQDHTWEITATKRQSGRWSLLASFTETWSREAALGTGNDFTPNGLVNSTDHQDRFTTWQAKVNGTMSLPWGFLVVPVLRHQSGTPFARTFVRTLNYGTATLKAEPITANRTPNITLFDLRTEKTFRVKDVRVMGFFDVYNILNTNAAQTLTTSSGALLAAADGDHRAAHPSDRRASGMVVAATEPQPIMSWVTVIWSMIASACLTLAAIYWVGLVQEPHGVGPSALCRDGSLDRGVHVL